MKPWFYNEQSITEFKEPVAYKGLNISVSKTKVNPPYIAIVTSPATSKEVLRTGGNTEQEALDSAKQAVDKREADAPKISASGQTSILFNTPSNDELLKDPTMYNHIYAKISKDQNGPTLVIGNEIYGAADLEADGFRRSDRRNPKKAGEDALPQVAVNASNKTLSQMGIKMNGRYTMDIEDKYEDDKGHTVYPLQFQSSTIHAGDKERMKRPGLTIGMKREDVEPWFQREFEEAEIIKFPEPVKNVVELPNVQSYPDFLTGVKDLQNRLSKGEISQDSHDRLYQDLIHRFMRKESFETPWFLREKPEGIMSTDQATTGKLKWIKDKLSKGEIKDADTIDYIFKILNKEKIQSTIDSLVAGISQKDADIQGFRKKNQGVFSKLLRKMPIRKEQLDAFLSRWNNSDGFVDTSKLVLGNKGLIKDLITDPVALQAFQIFESVKSQYKMPKRGTTGYGEFGMAMLSNNVRMKAPGDIEVNGNPVEVKGNDARLYADERSTKVESFNEARGDAPGLITNAHKNLQNPDESIRKPTVKAVADAFASRGINQNEIKQIIKDAQTQGSDPFKTLGIAWWKAGFNFYVQRIGMPILVMGEGQFLISDNADDFIKWGSLPRTPSNFGYMFGRQAGQSRETFPKIFVPGHNK